MFHIPAHKNVDHPGAQVAIEDTPSEPAIRAMDPMLATGLAEGWEEPHSAEEVVAAWQYLHTTGLAYQLQGWFGRTAQALLEEGIIHATA